MKLRPMTLESLDVSHEATDASPAAGGLVGSRPGGDVGDGLGGDVGRAHRRSGTLPGPTSDRS